MYIRDIHLSIARMKDSENKFAWYTEGMKTLRILVEYIMDSVLGSGVNDNRHRCVSPAFPCTPIRGALRYMAFFATKHLPLALADGSASSTRLAPVASLCPVVGRLSGSWMIPG